MVGVLGGRVDPIAWRVVREFGHGLLAFLGIVTWTSLCYGPPLPALSPVPALYASCHLGRSASREVGWARGMARHLVLSGGRADTHNGPHPHDADGGAKRSERDACARCMTHTRTLNR